MRQRLAGPHRPEGFTGVASRESTWENHDLSNRAKNRPSDRDILVRLRLVARSGRLTRSLYISIDNCRCLSTCRTVGFGPAIAPGHRVLGDRAPAPRGAVTEPVGGRHIPPGAPSVMSRS